MGHFSLNVTSRTCLAILSWDILDTLPNQRIWDLSIWRRYDFTFRVLRNSKLRTLSRSVTLWILHKKTISRICTWGEDRNKNRLKKCFCSVWKHLFFEHRAIKLTQECVCFSNPSFNLLVPPSVSRVYYPKVLDLLDLLQRTATSTQSTLTWVAEET